MMIFVSFVEEEEFHVDYLIMLSGGAESWSTYLGVYPTGICKSVSVSKIDRRTYDKIKIDEDSVICLEIKLI